MRLYHGSNIVIDSINLAMCRPYKDFGKGFYLTDIEEQAEKMAVRVTKIYGGFPIVNIFEIEDDFRELSDIKIKDFGAHTTEEWAKFVMNNRNRAFEDDVTAHMSCHQTDFFICQETAHICVIYCLGRQITCLPMNYRLTCLDSSMIA